MVNVSLQANGYISSIHDATGIASGGVKGEGVGAAVAPALECTVRPCILNCNGRGSSVNGTCHCEPIYAGSDCSISLMAAAAEELLEGLDINYKHGRPRCTRMTLPLPKQHHKLST
jgi:hypothetical protein